ncbi:MAG: glutamyl-tRNA amidotransferase [Candidatus Thiodiazotropha lotti]|uniref:glutamyl-tRNA amidotransferase n=1 Tax=Candidatus Thiodiazotropha endoloripes TaxID=1818881 RepID=UPI001F23210B|nr:glutamyl-tRNA amidotransferase [Candidatus Thiodiazotropha endoloripes]MCG7898647.1 glutamyl-tRNA amidotransferase [Candidatus Thiodiazotropha weberae]MCG7991931.1 glutamyl-tRNA amidotransferase [Candidatus Thiodiazotropha lotti]MCG7901969.1 glutamyl-tRNA amidotransferase [Candidatus Thiodiazotropha weberae]MCG7914890.1 glutamyl-tRNA amidotransferase [Candidatus Thiodiazotropha weberae]MCG7998435.1 glutamyl-tRNA amidotransferase [Candidatus Thiodiazotropha lotti]
MNQLTPEERRSVESLAWLSDVNVERDVQAALDKRDKRLLGMMGRATDLPGVPTELTSKAKTICGIRYVEGSTDVVRGEVHLKLLQRAYDYAAAYNQAILKQCLDK